MNIVSELFDNAKTALQFRTTGHKRQVKLDKKAPKAGEMAPDFTLFDVAGTESVTLSDFRGKKPVALVLHKRSEPNQQFVFVKQPLFFMLKNVQCQFTEHVGFLLFAKTA